MNGDREKIRQDIASLERKKPKNLADFEHRESEMKRLIELLPRGRY